VKTDVEELSPTRVRLTIEVPFEELKPNLDHAYREVARQVRIPGFRPGRVPPRVIDQRIGRGAVLEQAVNDAVPQLYGKALEEHDVFALGQPAVEITKLDDGKELAFTAEVDVRPHFDIPDIDGMPVTVDDADVTPDQVEEYIGSLRERFASLKGAERPAAEGDFVSIDLSAEVEGQPVEDAQANGISYEVGSGQMLDGLDEALTGMSSGETKTFTAELAAVPSRSRNCPSWTTTSPSPPASSIPSASCGPGPAPSSRACAGPARRDRRASGRWTPCSAGSTSRCPKT
jgi:trigger factor